MMNLLNKIILVICIISLVTMINIIIAFLTPADDVDPTKAGTYTSGYSLPKYLYDDCKVYSKTELLLAINGDAEDTKKYTKVKAHKNGNSSVKKLLTNVTDQCISLVAAGIEIITVRVLNNILVVCERPTIYI